MCTILIKKHNGNISFESQICGMKNPEDWVNESLALIFEAYVAILNDMKVKIQKLPRETEAVKIFENHIMSAHSVLDKVAQFDKGPE